MNDMKNITISDDKFKSVSNEKLIKFNGLFEELISNRNDLEQLLNEVKEEKIKNKFERENKIILELQNLITTLKMVDINDTLINKLKEFIEFYSDEHNKDIHFEYNEQKYEFDKEILDKIYLIIRALTLKIFDENENAKCKIELKVITKSNETSIGVEISIDGQINHEALSKVLQQEEKDLINKGLNLTYKLNPNKVYVEFSVPKNIHMYNALIIKIGKHLLAIPTNQVDTIVNAKELKVDKSNHKELIVYRGKVIRLFNLKKYLNIPSENDGKVIVIVKIDENTLALSCDEVIGQRNMVVKPMNKILSHLDEYLGTTMLGNGKVAFVLNINSILNNL